MNRISKVGRDRRARRTLQTGTMPVPPAGPAVWLTQQHMAELFQTTQQNISLHLQNIYEEGELQLPATHKEFLSVRREGNRDVQRRLDFYNLDAIISVGYRVKSRVATRFRIWATQRLREYIVKGFVLDDERLKNPDQPFDYFEELTRRIQDIRTSERRFYQKITDIYATSIDYDPTQEISICCFSRRCRTRCIGPSPARPPPRSSIWIKKLDAFLTLNERDILAHAGRISHEMAQAKAEAEYEKFHALEAAKPSPVDEAFSEAIERTKQIEAGKRGRKKP